MKRISTSTKVADKFGAGKDGFTDGNAGSGIPPTDLEAALFDHIQEELCAIIEEDGGASSPAVAPDPASRNQLITKLKAMFARKFQAAELVDGTAKVATQAQTNAGTDDATIVTPKKLRAGFSASLTTNGHIAFPSWLGSLIIQWGQFTTLASSGAGGTGVTFPVAFLTDLFSLSLLTANTSSLTATAVACLGASGIGGFEATTKNSANAFVDAGVVFYIAFGK